MFNRRRPMPRWLTLVFLSVTFAVGIGMLLGGLHRAALGRPVSGGVTATGTVVSVTTGQNCGRSGCSTYWVPEIAFTPEDSPQSDLVTFYGPQEGEIAAGASVKVSYSPADPSHAHDLSAGAGSAVLLELFGSLVSAIALASFLVGLGRLHRVVGWSSAREGSGFVGHSRLHAVDAMVLLMFLVLLAAVLFVQPSV